MDKFITIIIFIVIVILLASCTTYSTGNYCGGFPSKPTLRPMQDETDITTIMNNTIDMKKYIDLNEIAKQECKYVVSY